MEIEGLEGGAGKVCNYQRGNGEKGEAGEIKSKEGETGCKRGRHRGLPGQLRLSWWKDLFMRSVVDRDCGFFKDKIVTTDTQRGRDEAASGT